MANPTRTKRIYEVLADGRTPGPAADGTHIHRFSRQAEADAFAAQSTCYGRPAKVLSVDAPLHIARRWGF